jgi:hypothetical protein
VRELPDEEDRVAARRAVIDPGIGNVQVENGGDDVEHDDHRDRGFGRAVDPGLDERHVEVEQHRRYRAADQHAAQQGAQDDRGHREALDPAVRDHESIVRQELGQDAVFRG